MAALAGCGGADTAVELADGHSFEPPTLEVAAGETITFRNGSAEAHTVTAYDDSLPEGAGYFASGGLSSEAEARERLSAGLLTQGESYSLMLEVPGTYRYFCVPHEGDGMTGVIVVRG